MVERLCDFKIYAISVLCIVGSVCAPDKATLKAENHALQCTTAGQCNAFPSTLLGVCSVCGLGPDLVGIHSLSLAARYRIAACSTTLSRGLEKISTARGHNCTPTFALSHLGKEFLIPSMAPCTANAFDIVCGLDRNDTLDDVPRNKRQKVATGLLLDKLRKQDFAGPLSSRASRILGPISRHRVADILPHKKSVSRASRPGLLVGFLRILCNGLCTAQRFHTEEHEHTCRIGCPNEPDSLSQITMSVPGCTTFLLHFWRHAAIAPHRNHLLHDSITRDFLRSLQYWIVVLGLLDAFVYAHQKHRQGGENPGNFGDCMKGRIRLMTAITPAHAHAYLATCLARHLPAVPHQNFRLPKLKARYPYLPNARSTTRERGNDYRGWAIYTDGGTRIVDGETLAGWSVISRSPLGRIDVMFHPVIITEAHLAFSGARTHSNNTAEMTAMVEALSFLGPHGPVARDEQLK